MNDDERSQPESRSLWEHVCCAYARIHARRTISFYLFFLVLIGLLLSTQLIYLRDSPRRFFVVLALLFILFFAVIFRAVVDCFDIARRHYAEHEEIYRETLGDTDFAKELGERVAKKRQDPRA